MTVKEYRDHSIQNGKTAENGRLFFDFLVESGALELWSNNACLGYVVYALEQAGKSPDEIQEIVCAMKSAFSTLSIDEADKHYCDSEY